MLTAHTLCVTEKMEVESEFKEQECLQVSKEQTNTYF